MKEEEDGCHKNAKRGQRTNQSKSRKNDDNGAAKEEKDGCYKSAKTGQRRKIRRKGTQQGGRRPNPT